MTEEEISKRATKLIKRFDNMKIVGGGGEWSGSARQGFAFNPKPIGVSTGEGPVEPTGACCPEDGDCFITIQSICEAGGGTYQGDGTDCDPDPCPPPTPTGACCVGTDCTIETEDDCTGMGGTYQGDDTTCDPNPCEMPPCNGCGFDAFDGSGRKFLTATFHETASCSVPISGCACTVNFTSVQTINPDDCTMSSVCSGDYDCDDGSHMDWQEPPCNTLNEQYGCCANEGTTFGFCGELCVFPGCEPIGTSATHAECSWHNEPVEHINDGTITVDLSNECTPI